MHSGEKQHGRRLAAVKQRVQSRVGEDGLRVAPVMLDDRGVVHFV
jgi:hypothetical protein